MKNRFKYYRCLSLIAVLITFFIYTQSSSAQDQAQEKKTIPLDIRTESLNMNLESDIWRIPDAVEIEYETFVAKGVNLVYDMKENRGTLDGDPKITATYGTDTRISTGHVDFDLESELLTFSGGCNFYRKNASGTVEFDSGRLLFQMKEEWLRSPGPTTLHYEAPKKETAPVIEFATETVETEKKKTEKIDITAFDMKTGPMIFMKTGERLSASGPVIIEFEEGSFEAGEIDVDMKNEIMNITGEITGKFRENRFTAESAQLKYGDKELTATGGITFEKFDSDIIITADNLWYRFKKDDTDFDLTENVHVKMNIKKKSKKEDSETVNKEAEGSAP